MKHISARSLIFLGIFLFLASTAQAQQPGKSEAVTAYLAQIDDANMKLSTIARELRQSTNGLRETIASGQFDSEKIKSEVDSFVQRMMAEGQKVSALDAPEEARVHQGLVVKQIDIAHRILAQTLPMLDIAAKVAELKAAFEATEDEEAKMAIQTEMNALQQQIEQQQVTVQKLSDEGDIINAQVAAERERLEN